VLLNDISRDKLDAGLKVIDQNLHRQVARGKLAEADMSKAMKRIKPVDSLDAMKEVDFAIEAATEDEQVKRKIFQDLCPKLSKNAMIATNTSSISITRLAASTDRPERFIGVHFMNPVPMMQLVELIRGIATEEETFQTALEMVRRLGKIPANSEDFPAGRLHPL
jgi:3-hydroxybutyryl-CoA dehydrogenase